jgi:hypothetical protein
MGAFLEAVALTVFDAAALAVGVAAEVALLVKNSNISLYYRASKPAVKQ